jgi:hypothetical protein
MNKLGTLDKGDDFTGELLRDFGFLNVLLRESSSSEESFSYQNVVKNELPFVLGSCFFQSIEEAGE